MPQGNTRDYKPELLLRGCLRWMGTAVRDFIYPPTEKFELLYWSHTLNVERNGMVNFYFLLTISRDCR